MDPKIRLVQIILIILAAPAVDALLKLSARAMPSPINAHASVTDAIPTSVLHKPQLLQRSLAGKAWGQAPVMARGAVLVERASAVASRRTAAAACGIADKWLAVSSALTRE